MANSNPLNAQARKLQDAMRTLPIKVGDTAILFIKSRFREQAWADTATQPWRVRKYNGKNSRGRALLVKSGRLRRSFRIIRVSPNSVTVGSDVPYAAIHNDGFRGQVTVAAHTRTKWKKTRVATGELTATGRQRMATLTSADGSSEVAAHKRNVNMPRRRMIGKSRVLDKQVTRLISATILKATR